MTVTIYSIMPMDMCPKSQRANLRGKSKFNPNGISKNYFEVIYEKQSTIAISKHNVWVCVCVCAPVSVCKLSPVKYKHSYVHQCYALWSGTRFQTCLTCLNQVITKSPR